MLEEHTRVAEEASPWRADPTKDNVADYLEDYAERFGLPVRTGVRVDRVGHDGDVFEVTAGDRTFTARHVVVATGAYHTPRIPDFADELAPDITQLHSSGYRNPDQLQDGPVLVVGAGNSGAEIALDVSRTHPTWLSGRDPGHEPTRSPRPGSSVSRERQGSGRAPPCSTTGGRFR